MQKLDTESIVFSVKPKSVMVTAMMVVKQGLDRFLVPPRRQHSQTG